MDAFDVQLKTMYYAERVERRANMLTRKSSHRFSTFKSPCYFVKGMTKRQFRRTRKNINRLRDVLYLWGFTN